MKFEISEIEQLIEELGYSIDDLDDVEILAYCTNTCIFCKSSI